MSPLLLYALGLAGLGGVYALDRLANTVVRPPVRRPDRSVPDLGLAHEPFGIPSGPYELSAWLVHAAETGDDASERPVVLLAHGWGASHGIVLRLVAPLARMGHDVVLFDVRGHGHSGAVPYVTVRSFRDDLMAAVASVRERFASRPLVVIGHSFGGAAAVLAAAEGAAIDGLVLIATPSDVLRITAEFLTARGLPGALMVTTLLPFWWRRVRGTFGPLTPWRRIAELDQPLLIIQPEHDQRVARWHAERLAAAAGVDYHLVPDREHTDVLEAPVTLDLIRAFLERVRGPVRRPA